MMKIVKGPNKTLLYDMVINEIIDFHKLDTRFDHPKSHPMHSKTNSHAIKKLGYELKEGVWVRKSEYPNDEDDHGELSKHEPQRKHSKALSSKTPSTSNIEHTLTNLFGYIESMDGVNGLYEGRMSNLIVNQIT
ncbi:Uncharacterized protein TCM_040141 [Theobroma cacao]|uniref:Uncharacterized protein n=1 Tax=Theobroma cacao TaxID=3641 RepID=A0A061GYS9_THECC|nr:Uncharacterized protein TCM_040141 [Theobroma cacao]